MTAPAPRRRWRRRLALLLGIPLAVAVVAELVLAAVGIRFRFPEPCRWDPGSGCLLEPNRTTELAFGRVRFEVTTNSDGRRDRPRGPKTPGHERVLVLGDEVAFGVGVADDETLAARLEARLPGAEVVNAGSPFLKGTGQQLGYFLDHARDVRPDLVVLVFNVRNDFADNAHRTFWRPGAGGLERVPCDTPERRLHRWVLASERLPPVRLLDRWSSLWGLFRFAYWNILHLTPIETGDAVQPTADVLARLAAEVGRAHARLAVVSVPTEREVDLARRHEPPMTEGPEADLAALTGRLGLPFVDPTALVAAASADAPLMDDGFFTPRGNDALAEAIAAKVPGWLGAANAAAPAR